MLVRAQMGAAFVFTLQALLFFFYIYPYEDVREPFGCILATVVAFTTVAVLVLNLITRYATRRFPELELWLCARTTSKTEIESSY